VLVEGVAPTLMHSVEVGLSVSTAAPKIVTLVAPPDGGGDVSVVPALEWMAADGAQSYTVQLATDGAFADVVFEAEVTETGATVDPALDPETTYYWRVQAHNACGDGAMSAAWSFTTLSVPPILLVDDDDNNPDVRSMYEAALGGLGFGYDVWNTDNSDNEPTADQLAPYEVVIWFTGDEFGGYAGPGSAGEAALAAWLENGGCLFVSSQDYHYDRGLTGFMTDYLGVSTVQNDVTQTSVTAAGAVFGSLGAYPLTYPFSNYSDRVDAAPDAEVSFVGNIGNAAVDKDGGVYRTAFLGFPIEAIDIGGRTDVVQTMLEWCAGLSAPCPADIDDDGFVGVSDLLGVLGAWGDLGGAADVNDDGVVDVQDLLAVLSGWGACA
jgi:hypothetical protein